MTPAVRERRYDLTERTFAFAESVFRFVKTVPRSVVNQEVVRQLVRSAGSVGANYIEADASLGKKDLLMKVRTCKREAKESVYWLRLLDAGAADTARRRTELVDEAGELVSIFGAITSKLEARVRA